MISCQRRRSFAARPSRPNWVRTPLCLGLLLVPGTLFAQQSPGPLELVPAQADIVVKIERPSKAVETLYQHDAVKDLLKIDGVRDLFDTTNFRRALQLKDHFEKKLGVQGLDMLERLTGGGVVLAARVHDTPALLLVVQSRDEAFLRQFVDLSVSVLEQELARQEVKQKIVRRKFGQFDGFQYGDGCAAIAGPNMIFASHPIVLQMSLDLLANKGAGSIAQLPSFLSAQKLLPAQPMAWAWVDLESARKVKNFKDGLDSTAMYPNALFVFGGLLDLIRRSPFVVASLSQEGKNFVLENRMPIGRDSLDARALLYMPKDDKASLPPLQPARTLASISYYLDLKAFWENRSKLLNKEQVAGLEKFDADTAKFLGGNKFSTLLKQTGPHQRIVVAQPLRSPYKIKPETPIPAFALVQEVRDPNFGKTMNTLLRAGGFFASFQFGLRMVEEKHGEHTVVAYYFNENKPIQGDTTYLALNYSPSFVLVNNQLVISSTAELAHDLIDELLKEGKSPSAFPATTQIALFASGAADALRAAQDQLLAQAVLSQALPPAAARKQIEALIGFVEKLGSVRLQVEYGQNDFRYAVRWQYK